MSDIIKSIVIMAAALIAGRLSGALVSKSRFSNIEKEYHVLKEVQRWALTILIPLSSVFALWIADLDSSKYIAIPFFGIAFMIIANIAGRIASKAFSDRKHKAVVFGSTAFSNLGSIGRLASFMLLGEAAMGYLPLFRLTEMFFVIAVGFTTIQSIQSGEKISHGKILKSLKDPIIIATFSAVVIGLSLNLTGVARPSAFDIVNDIVVPGGSFIVLYTIGYRLKITHTVRYLKGAFMVSAIKLFALPAVIAALCYITGLYESVPVACQTMVLLSGMPPAFLSVTAAQIYDGDVDMANSILLINIALMFAWLPLAKFLLGIMF